MTSTKASHIRRFVGALIIIVLLTPASHADEEPISWDKIDAGQLPTDAQVRATLARFQVGLELVKKATAKVPPTPANHPDFRGRTLSDDWRDYVLTPATLASIAEQRQRVLKALQQKDIQAAIGPLQKISYEGLHQAALCQNIVDYWTSVGRDPPNWVPYTAMLQANDIEPHYAKNFESLQRTFVTQINHGLFPQAMSGTFPKIKALHVRAGSLDSLELQRLDSGSLNRLDATTRAGDCSPPAARTSGNKNVKLDTSQPKGILDYPTEARERLEEGDVYVGLIVTQKGCVRLASVFGSSGYERLDRSAVTHALGMRFLPAEKDGSAIELQISLPIAFRLAPGPDESSEAPH